MSTASSSVVDSVVIGSVLVIDDSPVQRAHGVEVCRELGVTTVHEASNGLEALALLEALNPAPDLLIIDLEMPTMDGAELLSHLAQRCSDVPIIVASSREPALLRSVHHMAGELGLTFLGAVQKPLGSAKIRMLLGNRAAVLSRRAAARPERLSIDAAALREGLERNEIVAYYQPQIEIRTGAVRGVEALARWQHPDLGLIGPDQFVALAEESELIHPLTLQVMNQAMLQVSEWNARDIDLKMSINLSPTLLDRPELVQEIADLQRCYGLRPKQLIFEVTESSLLRRPAVALGVLTRLCLRGFGLSLDDYGTGFSSMKQLAQIPFTELKIDRSFVQGANERQNLQVMLRSALEMAAELGLATVAEGVECEQELQLLTGLGCTLAQGWLFAKAMPGAEVLEWMQRRAG